MDIIDEANTGKRSYMEKFVEEYTSYSACLHFFIDNNISTFKHFESSFKQIAFDFNIAHPTINVAKLVADLRQFEDDQVYVKYLQDWERINDINAEPLLDMSIFDSQDPSYETLANQIKSSNERIVTLEAKIDYLEGRIEKMNKYIQHEFKKFQVNSDAWEEALNAGDLYLEDEWRVKANWVRNASHQVGKDAGFSTLATLVFGDELLKSFVEIGKKQIAHINPKFHKAMLKLCELYAAAKFDEQGGSISEIQKDAYANFTKRLQNWKSYQSKRERETAEKEKKQKTQNRLTYICIFL